MDFPAHAGSSDGECAIPAYMSTNYILVEHGDRTTNMTAGVTGVPEAWTCFQFEKSGASLYSVEHVYTLILTPRNQTGG